MSSVCACKLLYKCTNADSCLAGPWCLCRDLSTWWKKNVGPDTTGTLLVKDKSHEGHAPFFETACTLSRAEMAATTDHYQLKPQELPFFDSYETRGLRGKAGSVFLWDSRTIHAVSFLMQKGADHYRICLSIAQAVL